MVLARGGRMDDAIKIWDVECGACKRAVGRLLGARFLHDPDCALPLRIEGGALRCCRCGGVLSPREVSVPSAMPSIGRSRVRRQR
jgi:hypothetical protein